jgi:hypothetical protein
MGHGSPIGVGPERADSPNRGWLLAPGGSFRKPVVIVATALDAGNTGERTTKLRSGLVLGKITAAGPDQGKYAPCNEAATDGSQVAQGILLSKIDLFDDEGIPAERGGTLLFGPALVDPAKCFCTTGGNPTNLGACAASLTALRGDGMVFKGDA